jgi:hypothetical protein
MRHASRFILSVAFAAALGLGAVAATPSPAHAIGGCSSTFVYTSSGSAYGAWAICYQGPGTFRVGVYCYAPHAGTGGRWGFGPWRAAGLFAVPSYYACPLGSYATGKIIEAR